MGRLTTGYLNVHNGNILVTLEFPLRINQLLLEKCVNAFGGHLASYPNMYSATILLFKNLALLCSFNVLLRYKCIVFISHGLVVIHSAGMCKHYQGSNLLSRFGLSVIVCCIYMLMISADCLVDN